MGDPRPHQPRRSQPRYPAADLRKRPHLTEMAHRHHFRITGISEQRHQPPLRCTLDTLLRVECESETCDFVGKAPTSRLSVLWEGHDWDGVGHEWRIAGGRLSYQWTAEWGSITTDMDTLYLSLGCVRCFHRSVAPARKTTIVLRPSE